MLPEIVFNPNSRQRANKLETVCVKHIFDMN